MNLRPCTKASNWIEILILYDKNCINFKKLQRQNFFCFLKKFYFVQKFSIIFLCGKSTVFTKNLRFFYFLNYTQVFVSLA